jgi:hypothetical protein
MAEFGELPPGDRILLRPGGLPVETPEKLPSDVRARCVALALEHRVRLRFKTGEQSGS